MPCLPQLALRSSSPELFVAFTPLFHQSAAHACSQCIIGDDIDHEHEPPVSLRFSPRIAQQLTLEQMTMKRLMSLIAMVCPFTWSITDSLANGHLGIPVDWVTNPCVSSLEPPVLRSIYPTSGNVN
jgi:hypothetical protein